MKTLPEGFDPAKKDFELYEDVDYRAFWGEPRQRRVDASEKALIGRFLPPGGRRIIDLGGGFGRLAPCYLGRYDQVILFDGAISLLRQARATLGERVVYVAGDIRRIPFRPGSFDAALLIRVLQHVREVPGCLREARRILGRGGRLVFSFHNKRNLRRIVRWLLRREAINPFDEATQEVSRALLSHHPGYVRRALRACGFSAPEERGVGLLAGSTVQPGGTFLRSGLFAATARLAGSWNLAPWIIGRSLAVGEGPVPQEGTLESELQCPWCRGDVHGVERGFACLSCGRGYPLVDGILDFRIG